MAVARTLIILVRNDKLLSMATTVGFAEMRAFVVVVTEGSFTAGEEKLETDKARVSRIV